MRWVCPRVKCSSALSCNFCAARLPITPQSQLRSSAVSWAFQRVRSISSAASAGSFSARRMMASVTISLVRGRIAVIFSFRYFAGSLAMALTVATQSGSSMATACSAARGRLASIASRARRLAALGAVGDA
ncbi:hypothetical protein FQZ97_1206450 [compost metagenome]